MTIESELYWTLLETELHNEELYFPPDTPIANVNSLKLYKQLKHRHERQKARLLHQQVAELAEYQYKFSVQYQQNFDFSKPQIHACETISGSDFLATCQKDIEELISIIPKQSASSSLEEKREENEDVKSRKRKLDTAAQGRKQEYLKILKNKYSVGIELIEEKHQEELDHLLKMQKSDLDVIPPDILDPRTPINPAILRERQRTRSGKITSQSPPHSSRNRHNRLSPSSASTVSLSPTRRPNLEEDITDIRKAKRRREEDNDDGSIKRYDRHSKRSTESWQPSSSQRSFNYSTTPTPTTTSSSQRSFNYSTTPTPTTTSSSSTHTNTKGQPPPIATSSSLSIYDSIANKSNNNNGKLPQNPPHHHQNKVYRRLPNTSFNNNNSTTSRDPPTVSTKPGMNNYMAPPPVAPPSSSSGYRGLSMLGLSSSNSGPPAVRTINGKRAPPTIGSSASNSKRGPPTVASSSARIPPTVRISNSNRGPPTVASTNCNRGPPPVNIEPRAYFGNEAEFNGTRIVSGGINRSQPLKRAISKNHQQSQTLHYGGPAAEKRDSLPLIQQNRSPFHQQPSRQYTTPPITSSLLDKGNMMIRNKPTRVVIRGPDGTEIVYGNPMDYDDAMNSSKERQDNPVRKRTMPGGQDYLFYKTESGAFVAIGPVSKIQPLIHKFFLAL